MKDVRYQLTYRIRHLLWKQSSTQCSEDVWKNVYKKVLNPVYDQVWEQTKLPIWDECYLQNYNNMPENKIRR